MRVAVTGSTRKLGSAVVSALANDPALHALEAFADRVELGDDFDVAARHCTFANSRLDFLRAIATTPSIAGSSQPPARPDPHRRRAISSSTVPRLTVSELVLMASRAREPLTVERQSGGLPLTTTRSADHPRRRPSADTSAAPVSRQCDKPALGLKSTVCLVASLTAGNYASVPTGDRGWCQTSAAPRPKQDVRDHR